MKALKQLRIIELPWNAALLVGLCTGLVILLGGCNQQRKQPTFTYMDNMAQSPAFKAQEQGVMLAPVAGTIPRDYVYYKYTHDPEGAGRSLSNPVPKTLANLEHGQKMFTIYCKTCHGSFGEGFDRSVQPFGMPPTLQSDKVRGWTDGRIYHVITAGQARMPSYASQIMPDDRWAIVNYIRAIQRAKNPTDADLKRFGK